MSEAPILFDTAKVSTVTLNAPKKLNALSADMCIPLGNQLAEWRSDKSVKAVIVKGAGDKAFCAGGDIVDVVRSKNEDFDAACNFFWSEYRTNWRVKNFPKPYIALLDGITMGGGVGISVHGHFRIVTERTMFAMPETMIGFFPDVGGTYFLPRLKGALGQYLGLSGSRLFAADLLEVGVATHYVHSSKLDELEAAIHAIEFTEEEDHHGQVIEVINKFTSEPEVKGHVADHIDQINQLFTADKLEDIFTNLEADQSEFAQKILKLLNKMAPSSLKISFEQIKRGAHLDFDQCMKLELRLARGMMAGDDFSEGVRALLIDKDKNPQWKPDHVSKMSDEMVQKYFAPLEKELRFDWDQKVEFDQ